jgi:hypothetical protein
VYISNYSLLLGKNCKKKNKIKMKKLSKEIKNEKFNDCNNKREKGK